MGICRVGRISIHRVRRVAMYREKHWSLRLKDKRRKGHERGKWKKNEWRLAQERKMRFRRSSWITSINRIITRLKKLPPPLVRLDTTVLETLIFYSSSKWWCTYTSIRQK